MKKKNLILIVLLYFLSLINVEAIEADIFVQSTVNRASALLSKDISKNDKIEEFDDDDDDDDDDFSFR